MKEGQGIGTIKLLILLLFSTMQVFGQAVENKNNKTGNQTVSSLSWPPQLPGGKEVVTDQSSDFIKKPAHVILDEGVEIAQSAPTIDFLYFSGQTHPSKLWSVWGDGFATGSKYYTSIGDHAAPRGEAQVYEYDAKTKKLRQLMNVKEFLEEDDRLPPGGMDYIPGKIHSRTEMGSDGFIYFSTHRGSTKDNTTDERGYLGDHIYRVNPVTGEMGIAGNYPMPKHTIPASVLDPKRMIFYGGTAPGNDAIDKGVWFIAYDVKNNKLLKKEPGGFARYAIFSSSTGRVYWKPLPGKKEETENENDHSRKYDPNTNEITISPEVPVVRACTEESKEGIVYGFTQGNKNIWAFDIESETLKTLGTGTVASQTYVTSMDMDPLTQRYIYYVPGAHGGGIKDGSPLVQYDIKTNKRKIISFLSSFYNEKYGYSPDGSFSTAVNDDGSIVYVTWNGSRLPNAEDWDTVAMTAIHIPKSERLP